MRHPTKITVFLTILSTFLGSCSIENKDLQSSETKQAAAACVILSPVPPAAAACVVGVTATQVIVTVLVGGAVVGTGYALKKASAQTVRAGGYNVRVGPTAVPAPTPPKVQPKRTPCAPCPPARAPRIDYVPPSRPHFPCKGTHQHTFTMNQDPNSCQCFERPGPIVCL